MRNTKVCEAKCSPGARRGNFGFCVLLIIWSLGFGAWDLAADSWSETVFTDGTFTNTVATAGSAEVTLSSDTSQETPAFILAANAYHSLCPRTDGTLWSWGYGEYGQLGHGGTAQYDGDGAYLYNLDKNTPTQIGALTTWSKVACGAQHTMAIKTDGTLWAWGFNSNGQLGDGTTIQRNSPVQVGALTTWKQVAGGNAFTLAVKTDGTLWAWGYNWNGQLGDGTQTNRSSPVQIAGTTWKQVACGGNHTVAIKTDGTLWAWGYNGQGQLGDGTTTQRLSPVQVAGTTWKQVACGNVYTMAIKTDGTLWAWGYNFNGQLGDGTYTQRTSPVQIGALTTWSKVACGAAHTLAVKADGTLWAWGWNNSGQLGDGTTTQRTSPVQVGVATTWKQVACGTQHNLAVKTDGTLWAWGYNGLGSLGDGTNTDRYSPVQIGALTTWKAVVGTAPFLTPGSYLGSAIAPSVVSSWGVLTYTISVPANTLLTVDVLSSSNNSLLVANVSSGTNLSSAYPATFTSITGIKLRANLSTSNTTVAPQLAYWYVGYVVDRPPVLTSPGNKSINEKQLLTFTLSANDPDGDPITYTMTATPTGATLNLASGIFNWTPSGTQSGNYMVTFTATSKTLSDSKAITITVNEDPASLVTTAAWTMLTNGNTPVRMGQSVCYVKFNMQIGAGTTRWRRFRIDKGVTGVNTPCKIEVQVWCDTNTNGFWDAGDTFISKGNFTNGTCYLNMNRWQVTTTPKTYYIVYKLASDISGGTRAGVKIADSSYLEFENATAIGVPP
ncbi:MAG: hypothetical protein HY811_00640 [Planctomycetes bacterium]|nr:hypothetical protein [Planctomycetota bacterium]